MKIDSLFIYKLFKMRTIKCCETSFFTGVFLVLFNYSGFANCNINNQTSTDLLQTIRASEDIVNEIDSCLSETIWSFVEGWQFPIWNVCSPVCEYHGKTISLSQANRHIAWDNWTTIETTTLKCEQNIKVLKEKADSIKDSRYKTIADIWECYNFFCFTNLKGDVPYTDYLAGSLPESLNNDNQRYIYFSLINKLKKAGLNIETGTKNISPNSDDIFGGDMMKWKKFANTLLIRYAMYMSDAAMDSSKAILTEILDNPQTYPIMESNEDNAYYHYDGTKHQSLLYLLAGFKTDEAPLSNVFIERLVSLKDPRLPIFARPVKKVHPDNDSSIVPSNDGIDKYLGHLYGITTDNAYSSSWNGGIDFASKIGTYFRTEDSLGNSTIECAKTPLALATYPEMLFFLAEAREKGIITSSSAKEYYEKAVIASFGQYNATFSSDKYLRAFSNNILTSNEEYLLQSDVNYDGVRDKLTLIAEQKWIASFLLSFEPYFDHRRTMLPKLRVSSGAEAYMGRGSGLYFPAGGSGPTNNPRLIKNKGDDWLKMPVFIEPVYKTDYPKYNSDLGFASSFEEWYNNSWNSMLWWKTDVAETMHICKGESYKGYSESGTYEVLYKTAYNCDSIYTLRLFVDTILFPSINLVDGVLYSNILEGNQWYFNNTIVPGATDVTYTPEEKGMYSLSSKPNSCPSQFSNKIIFDPFSHNDLLTFEKVQVFPNPTTGTFEIDLNTEPADFIIDVYNAKGELNSTWISKNEKTIRVDLTNSPSGLYFVSIRNNESMGLIRIIKK